jgi:hypothetical protein
MDTASTDEAILGTVGRCIYCGSTDDLTDEHVIPLGLGGIALLRLASCETCAKITTRFERQVLREQLLAFRTKLGLPTRRPRSRPASFPARVRKGEDWHDVQMPVDRYTAVGSFPRLPLPGALVGRAPGAAVRIAGTAITVFQRDEIGNDPPRRAGVDAIEVTTPLHVVPFLRLIAKIAWGFSVALFTLDRLDPAILGVILGTDRDIPRWVGCASPEWRVFEEPTGTFQVRVADVQGFVLSWIRLFGPYGGPEYLVVVGRLRA